MKVVIIIPTYNEKGNIEKLINILQEDVFPKIKNHEMNILVVDDNSPDGTAEEVRLLMKKRKNIDLNLGNKQGLGAAYVRGMTYAIEKMGAEVMFEMDADGQHDHKKIPEFLKKIDEGFDIVIGTRYSGGGSIPKNWPPQRKAFSVLGNLIVRTIFMRFSIHDWTGGFRALKKEVFLKEKEELTSFKGYTFQVSFLHKAVRDGFKVAEVPFHFTDRTLGDSKIAPKEYIIDLLKYVFTARFKEIYHSPFMKYAIVGFSGYAINALGLEFFARTFNIKASIAASMGGEISIMWNFTLNNFWSFSGQKITSPLKLFLKFLQFNLISLGSLVIIGLVVGGGTSIFGETPLVRQLFLIIAVGFFIIPYSYTLYNVFIWKRWKIGFLSKLQNIAG